MSIELILNAANLKLTAFAYLGHRPRRPLLVSYSQFQWYAAEAAIGWVIAPHRNRETIWVDEIDLMKW
jgi:NADH:ubiquinone oxidoreductase subunit K